MKQGENKLHPFGHGGDIGAAAACAGVSAAEILDFSANINPLGPPDGLIPHLAAALPEIVDYPDPAGCRLVDAINGRYCPRGTVLPGNGAGELIYLLMRAVPPGKVYLPVPTFTLYEKAALAAGREISCHVMRQQQRFRPDVAALCLDIRREKPALAILCNPNNPTGVLLGREEILEVARACAEGGGYLLVDEAFLEFCPDWEQRSLLWAAEENIVVLCSLTKMYAIPGLRLGFLAGPGVLVEKIRPLRDPWSVNTLAQRAGEFVLKDQIFRRESASGVAGLAQKLVRELEKISGLDVYLPAANYIFLESTTMDSRELQQKMLREKVLIRDCGNYRGLPGNFVRVAVRSAADNRILVRAFTSVLGEETGGSHETGLDSSR